MSVLSGSSRRLATGMAWARYGLVSRCSCCSANILSSAPSSLRASRRDGNVISRRTSILFEFGRAVSSSLYPWTTRRANGVMSAGRRMRPKVSNSWATSKKAMASRAARMRSLRAVLLSPVRSASASASVASGASGTSGVPASVTRKEKRGRGAYRPTLSRGWRPDFLMVALRHSVRRSEGSRAGVPMALPKAYPSRTSMTRKSGKCK